jgi:hypothetical protein
METPSADTAPQTEWSGLMYFRIYESSSKGMHHPVRLFNNTRQYAVIKVGLIAVNSDGNVVELTKDDMHNRLTHINYDGGKTLGSDVDDAGWGYTFVEQTEYPWVEEFIPIPPNYPPDGQLPSPPAAGQADRDGVRIAGEQTYTIYVSTSSSAKVRIAARLTLPGTDGEATTTNLGADDEVGFGQDGLFHSSVQAFPVSLDASPDVDYGVTGNDGFLTPHDVGNTDNFFWATEYYLRVSLNGTDLKLKSVGSKAGTQDPFAIYARNYSDPSAKWAYSYVGQPNSSSGYFHAVSPFYSLELDPMKVAQWYRDHGNGEVSADIAKPILWPVAMYNECVGRIVNHSGKRVVIGLIKGSLEARFQKNGGGDCPDARTADLHIRDEYGNDHALRLKFGNTLRQILVEKV